ncbi:DUF2716 domain-containing protein [Nocardiopsis sp. CC223A]|uniref:DUF2716 domain-containing protein n=1 Tax=Nocardiopsis sp. CC223A TaxID=3044051 RepID=UPI00278C7D58|nr:DUF2716 domain-containing protein [Nocardiopsis sp. CC223A]
MRARIPDPAPAGAVAEHEGAAVVVRHGTHAVAECAGTPDDAATLVHQVLERSLQRGEPVEWRVYDGDPHLGAALAAAGFAPGWERSLLAGDIAAFTDPAPPPGCSWGEPGRDAEALAAAGGPHRVPLAEHRRDGVGFRFRTLALAGRTRAVAWFHNPHGSPFALVQGMSAPHPEFLGAMAEWTRPTLPRAWGWFGTDAPCHVAAEADGALRAMYLEAGLVEIGTVRSHHWSPPGRPPADRPVRELLHEAEHTDLWVRFTERHGFTPDAEGRPVLTPPPPAAIWALAAPDPLLERAARAALTARTRPGEHLYHLDRNHVGYRFDPRRVDGPGLPPFPGQVFPDGDYTAYVTADLRLGILGSPWEQRLYVLGDVLPTLEVPLTALLGPPLRLT